MQNRLSNQKRFIITSYFASKHLLKVRLNCWPIVLLESLGANILVLIMASHVEIWIQLNVFGLLAQGRNVTIDNYEDLYFNREQTVRRIFSDNTGINRFVISQSILKTLQLIFDNYTKDSILYSVNTDGFYMSNPKNTYQNKKDVKFKDNNNI